MAGAPRFNIEHALSLYADNFAYFPATGIYHADGLRPIKDVIATCHIYLVGKMPIVTIKGTQPNGDKLRFHYDVLGKSYDLDWQVPEDAKIVDVDGDHYFEIMGELASPSPEAAVWRLNQELGVINFEVQYVGQAYGQEGERTALDRLAKHETLQKIALMGVDAGYRLELLLLATQPANTIITTMMPNATNTGEGNERIAAGLDKLFGTTEKERVSLFEAALIRYFQPVFNKEFKDSFPSTNLKVLQDCYAKDFLALVAEINIDRLPFSLCSPTVAPKHGHLAIYDLHKDDERRAFFVVPPVA